MFDSNQFFSGGAAGFYPKEIDQSLRFNDNDSAYLTYTPSTSGNQKKWTFSAWVKRGNLGTQQGIFSGSSYSGNDGIAALYFYTDDTLHTYYDTSGTNPSGAIGSRVYRDTSAWYHIVWAVDAANTEHKIWVNNELVSTDTGKYPPDFNYGMNRATSAMGIGAKVWNPDAYLDGYMAEVYYCDGQYLTPDDFGELKENVWVAKSPSVTYGTNGFYLDFANSADIGNDVSGNGNDWTPNNFTASDVVLDSPTDNFCTLNPLFTGNGAQLADGNLRVTLQNGTAGWTSCASTMALPETGKYYAEFTVVNYVSGFMGLGFYLDGQTQLQGNTSSTGANNANWWSQYGHTTDWYNGGSATSGAQTWSSGTLMLAHDADTGKVWWGRNGSWFNSGNPSTGANAPFTITRNGRNLYMVVEGYNGVIWEANFGQLGFTYTPPTDYLALSTANLPDPVIDPAQGASPEDYFNTVLYTGNGSTQGITGVGHQPDLVWIKCRSTSYHHMLTDSVRGAGNRISSSQNAANIADANAVDSFDADGFTVDSGSAINDNTETFVGWAWKAGTSFSNSAGTNGASIASSGSANTDSGFSIVSYTGDSTGTDGTASTVYHGLSEAPEMIMFKPLDTYDGAVYHSGLTSASYRLILFSASGTAAEASDNGFFNGTAPTSSVFSIGSRKHTNSNGGMIAYCFHSVEGFSKVGSSYTGNGNADGPFVYTGFRPAFVMIKIATGDTGQWVMYDTARDTYNAMDLELQAESSNAEGTPLGSNPIDCVSNGFKIRSSTLRINRSTSTFIYMAFAEQPVKFSNAR